MSGQNLMKKSEGRFGHTFHKVISFSIQPTHYMCTYAGNVLKYETVVHLVKLSQAWADIFLDNFSIGREDEVIRLDRSRVISLTQIQVNKCSHRHRLSVQSTSHS